MDTTKQASVFSLYPSAPAHQPNIGQSTPRQVSSEHENPQTEDTGFFDGSYVSAHTEYKKIATKPYAFDYTIPKWSIFYNSTLIALDISMGLMATVLSLFLRPDALDVLRHQGRTDQGFLIYIACIILSWTFSLVLCHSYTRHTMGEGYELYAKIIKAGLMFFVVLCAIDDLFNLNFPRSLTVLIPLFTCMLTLLERWLMRRSLHRNRIDGEYTYSTIVVGSPQGIHDTVARLNENKGLGYKPIAVCPVAEQGDSNDPACDNVLISVSFTPQNDFESGLRVLPMNSHLPETAKYIKAQVILIADVAARDSETMRALSLATEAMGIELAFNATVADLDGATLHLRNDHAMPIFTARLSQYTSLTRVGKRLMDIVLSALALIVSSPLMAYVALRVKLQDGGPAIYKQQRIGLYGKPFKLYKFRSMSVDADKKDAQLAAQMGTEHGVLFKPKNDPRVTEFGKFIRKTSLDEFPQFLNVLKGDMSLVGPRPQQQYEVDEYGTLYSARLLVKPGITGPWQISGRSDLDQKEAEQLDISYIQNWSFTGDIAILLKTVTAVLRGTGSY